MAAAAVMDAVRGSRSLSAGTLALIAVGAAFSVLFLALTAANPTGWDNPSARDDGYNLLVAGFQKGQLSLDKPAPAGMARLANPWDPAANARYRYVPYDLHNLSYYRGKLYIYFGVTPALLLFWPWEALTGRWLYQREAAAIFCCAGLWASLAILRGLWRRYFPDTSAALLAALGCALALLAGGPILLQQADLCETPVACGYALAMIALGAMWLALHQPARQGPWLAAASLALGLAAGSRPLLVFGGAVLLLPLLLPLPGSPRPARLWLWALGPAVLCGIGLMLYNQARFGSPFEFGQRYQLAVDWQEAVPHFSLRYLWFNFCVDFLEPVRWFRSFPYVGSISLPPRPAYHGSTEDAYGVLANLPLLCWAAAAPLAWRNRPAEESARLRRFLLAAGWLFASAALGLCLFYWNSSRYEADFLPELTLLAVIGVLALERRLAGRPGLRLAARAAWIGALVFSAAFVFLDSVAHYGQERAQIASVRLSRGRAEAAIPQFVAALRAGYVSPEVYNLLGNALLETNRPAEAVEAYQAAVRLNPRYPAPHINLAIVLGRLGRADEARIEQQIALRLEQESRGGPVH